MNKNKVVLLDNPMGQEDLDKLNAEGWGLKQVVIEEYVWFKQMEPSPSNTPKKIFYRHRYHHYFTNDAGFKVWEKQPDGTWRTRNKWSN